MCGSAFLPKTTRPAKLVLDKFAGIKGDRHVTKIVLSVSETARLIAVCSHAAWPDDSALFVRVSGYNSSR
jgi:hypothetical protein